MLLFCLYGVILCCVLNFGRVLMEFPRSHCGILDLLIARKYVYSGLSVIDILVDFMLLYIFFFLSCAI